MIVMTKTLENGAIAKVTFESEVGSLHTTQTNFVNGKAYSDDYIPKDEAFDMIQLMLKNKWKQGE